MEKKANVEKRKPKGDIKFQISLNEEQKAAKQEIINNTVTVIRGMAGSGKTLVAAQCALDMLFKREVERIVIARPMVARTDMGALPGSADEKLHPWLIPIYANLYILYNKMSIDKLVEEGIIEILPFQFMRGRTLTNSFVIIDEAQNITHEEMEMVIGRLGKESKMVLCGDTSQIDLRNKKDSGLDFLKNIEQRVNGLKNVILLQNHRHPIVKDILEVYKEYRD
jgi:phosphate starvation-inducible PhoH-like protein